MFNAVFSVLIITTTIFSTPLPSVNKIVSTAPDLQPKQSVSDPLEDQQMEGEGGKQGSLAEEGEEEAGDSDSDDDDVQITIGDITAAPGAGYNRTPSYTRLSLGTGGNES